MQNPVLTGFHPDPSVCRVGADFYLVTSTFEFFPGLPVHHSRDLVHWRPLGHVLDRPDQVPLDGVRSSGGLYAPTLRHHDGMFYLVCTAIGAPLPGGGRGDWNFLVTTPDPAGPWSDPVPLDVPGFDPSLFVDEDGTAWLHGTELPDQQGAPGRTRVWLQRFDLKRLEPLGERTVLWTGAAADARWAEGPHLYRIGGHYYLLSAEGGTAEYHAVVVARADQVTGPYLGDQANPVLTHRHLGRGMPISAVGHADLVDTPDGQWWAVLLATRPYREHVANLGRETFLVEVDWQDGWPVFAPGAGRLQLRGPAPALPAHPWPAAAGCEQFDAADPGTGLPGPDWFVARTPRARWWTVGEGRLRIRPQPHRLGEAVNLSMLLRRQEHRNFAVRAAVDFRPAEAGDCAGLVLYLDDDHNVRLVLTGDGEGGRVLAAIRREAGEETVLAQRAVPPGPVVLAVQAAGLAYTLGVADPDWSPMVTTDGSLLTADGRRGRFTGASLGLYASAGTDREPPPVDVAWFEYRGLPDDPQA